MGSKEDRGRMDLYTAVEIAGILIVLIDQYVQRRVLREESHLVPMGAFSFSKSKKIPFQETLVCDHTFPIGPSLLLRRRKHLFLKKEKQPKCFGGARNTGKLHPSNAQFKLLPVLLEKSTFVSISTHHLEHPQCQEEVNLGLVG